MLGMHGTVFANFAVDQSDLLLAFGVRFDDRVTGKLETFASNAKIVHIDIDPAELNKNKDSFITVTGGPTQTPKDSQPIKPTAIPVCKRVPTHPAVAPSLGGREVSTRLREGCKKRRREREGECIRK